MRIYPHGKHTGLAPERNGPLKVIGGGGAAICRPYLDPELARQKDRTGCFAATEVQNPHAGVERNVARQHLRLAKRVLTESVFADPVLAVLRRPRKSPFVNLRIYSGL